MIPVLLSDLFIQDIGDVWDFIAALSAESATRITDSIIDAALSLGEFPSRHPRAEHFGDDVHRLNVGSWAVFYEVKPNVVEVLRVVAGAADLQALKLKP